MWFIIIAIIVIIRVALFINSGHDCPRQVLGYKCKGPDCDHSCEALADARRTMR